MGRDPYLIVKDYLESKDDQVRKNALTALAVLGDDASLHDLADRVLGDPDVSVRARAEEEIQQLAPESGGRAIATLQKELTGPRQNAAYVILGRFRNRGLHVDIAKQLPLLTRLRLSNSLRNELYPLRGVRFLLRTCRPALVSSLIGGAFMLLVARFVVGVSDLDGESIVGLAFASALAGVITAISVTRKTTPSQLHADPGAALILDLGWTFVVSSVAAILSLAIVSMGSGPNELISADVWLLLLSIPLYVLAIRVGTHLAFGHSTNVWANRVRQVAGGAAFGILILTAMLLRAPGIGSYSIGVLWISFASAAFGIADAFRAVDQSGSLSSTKRGARGQIYTLPIIVLMAVLYLISRDPIHKPVILQNGQARDVTLVNLPSTIPIESVEDQTSKLAANGCEFELRTSADVPLLNEVAEFERFTTSKTYSFKKEKYILAAKKNTSPFQASRGLGGILSEIAPRVSASHIRNVWTGTPPSGSACVITFRPTTRK